MHPQLKLYHATCMGVQCACIQLYLAIATYFFLSFAREAPILTITNPSKAIVEHNTPLVIVKPSNILNNEAVTCFCRPNNKEICRQLTFLHAVLVTLARALTFIRSIVSCAQTRRSASSWKYNDNTVKPV